MEEKVCIKCGILKPVTEFYPSKRNKTGYMGTCKVCRKLYYHEPKQIERKRQYERDHYQERKPKKREYLKRYRKTDKYIEYHKSEKVKKQQKEYRKTEGFKIKYKEYRKKNKEKYKYPKKRRSRENKRYREDEDYNIIRKLRSRFYKATHSKNKSASVLEITGCSLADFKKHFESLFTEGMTWELFYQGKIHIDHIIPLDAFNMKNPLHQRASFHRSNLQPLWRKSNLEKSFKYKQEDFDAYMKWFIDNVIKK
jgi:hypothetical protein